MKIAIHGCGYVGSALVNYFAAQNHTVVKYDPAKGFFDDTAGADFHFIAVPTPYDEESGGFVSAHVRTAIDKIARESACATIIIKSTVIPGTTNELQSSYPNHVILFNPEFLTEKTADKDFLNPDRQIVGYVQESHKEIANRLLELLPAGKQTHLMSAAEAELVKYFCNAYFSVKVIYANMMYDFCQRLGADYERVRHAFSHDTRIGGSHLDIFHGGYRGYGGSCLPKDTKTLIQLGKVLGIHVGLLEVAEQRNKELQQ